MCMGELMRGCGVCVKVNCEGGGGGVKVSY